MRNSIGTFSSSALTLTLTLTLKAQDEDRHADFIFLDFVKALNRMAHDVLRQKLCNFSISGALLKWCKDYLTKREQRVVTDGVNSSWCSIPSRLPKGSLLGPPFFFFLSVTSVKLLLLEMWFHYLLTTAKRQG